MTATEYLRTLRADGCLWREPSHCRGPHDHDLCGDPVRFPPKCTLCQRLVAFSVLLASDQLHDQLTRTLELFQRGWDSGVKAFMAELCDACARNAPRVGTAHDVDGCLVECSAHPWVIDRLRAVREGKPNVLAFEPKR